MSNAALFDLRGKKALVTGGATGIGRSCAAALASAGADVAIVDCNEVLGPSAAAEIRDSGRDSIFVSCDVTQSSQVSSMVNGVARHFGRLDVAVNNAGIYRPGLDGSYPREDWDRVIGVNLTGTWLCAQAEWRQMCSQSPAGGKIINIASIAAHIACSNGAYDASKAGVVHLTKTLAAQWGGYNINVNSLSPGYVGTVFGVQRTEKECAQLRQLTPIGYVQGLEDLHGPLVFLASRASDYVTGQDIVVDGGHTLSTWLVPLERSIAPRFER